MSRAAGVDLVHHLRQVSRRPQDPLGHSHEQSHERCHEERVDPGHLHATLHQDLIMWAENLEAHVTDAE